MKNVALGWAQGQLRSGSVFSRKPRRDVVEPAVVAILPEQFRMGAALGDAAAFEDAGVFQNDAGDGDPLALPA